MFSEELRVWTEEQKLRRKIESSWFNHIGDTAIAGRLDRDLQDSTWEDIDHCQLFELVSNGHWS